MSRRLVPSAVLVVVAACSGSRGAPPPERLVPVGEGARNVAAPPPTPTSAFTGDTLEWVVVGGGRVTGRMRQWEDSGFTTVTVWELPAPGPSLRLVARAERTGLPAAFTLVGHDAVGTPLTETLATTKGALAFRTETGVARGAAGRAFAWSTSGLPELDAMLVRALLVTKARSLPLFPAGTATLATVGERTVAGAALTTTATLHLVAGLDLRPRPVWLDASGRLFARLDGTSGTVRRGFEGAMAALVAVQDSALLARDSVQALALALRPAGALVIRNARLFDPQSRRIAPGRAIVVRGDRIERVVADSALALPDGATVVDARGQVVLPGLWDLQARAGDGDGLLHLAAGVTSVRATALDPEAAAARRARWATGTTLGPQLHLAGVVDAPGLHAAATPMLAPDADSARALVRRWADAGAAAIAVRPSLEPRLLPAIAREAEARGLRLVGQPPHGMPVERFVREGATEVHRADVVLLDLLADSAYDTRTGAHVAAVARRGGGIDLGAARARALVATLRQRGVAVAPTLDVLETRFTTAAGQLRPGAAPYAERLPPTLRASLRGGGLAVSSPAERRRFAASFGTVQRLAKALYDAEVPLAPGSDAMPGFMLHRELELLARAGIPNGDVLAAATLGAARRLGRDSVAGRVAPGMRADLVIVDGDPTVHMASLRRATLVVANGVVLRPDRAYAALGIAPAVPSLVPVPPRAAARATTPRRAPAARGTPRAPTAPRP